MASEANITQPRPDVGNGRESMARRLRGLRADVVPNEPNLRCRQGRDRRREQFLQPTASGLQPLPVLNEPNFTEAEEKRHAKVFTHKCLRVHWGIVGVTIESRMERNQARRLELGGPYHEDSQGFVGIDNCGRYRRLRDGRGQ